MPKVSKNIKIRKNNGRVPVVRMPTKQRPARRMDTNALSDYIGLLADPCNSSMVHAPYPGAGSAYLMRTVDQILPFAGMTESATLDFAYEITPWNTPSLAIGCVAGSGLNGTLATTSVNNFVCRPSVVKAYRPVAACVKWVPTGAIAARSGAIGMSYSNSKTLPVAGTSITPSVLLRACQNINTNGTVSHEAVWLPSFGDQRMGNNADANTTGAGSITIVGLGVDGVSNGVNSQASGYIEVTIVWEWEPYLYETGAVAGIAPSPRFTLEGALGTIRDVGKFVFQHARMATQIYSAAAGGRYSRGPALIDY